MELKCAVQTYDWGKRGSSSMVATLMKSSPGFTVKDETSYAELWMGTHLNGPSQFRDTNVLLQDYVRENSHVLGEAVQKHFNDSLPYLFKVLSIRKALSIQVHPNKEQAEKLHEEQPNDYKDPNHKPELAIALTPFEALCGFRPIFEILKYLTMIPEFSACVGENRVAQLRSAAEVDHKMVLKKCFASLMTREAEIVAEQLKKLHSRMSTLDHAGRKDINASLFEQLYSDFPGDVGCFGIYLFNHLRLEPGDAIFLGPNEPHAYLSGDCVECMACSDNVIRAGLTPKRKDVETLVNMISYNCAVTKYFQSQTEDNITEIFVPPVPDFAVAKITIPAGVTACTLKTRSSASILIVINGKAKLSDGRLLSSGSVLFIPADQQISLQVVCGCHPMLMFQAMANDSYLAKGL